MGENKKYLKPPIRFVRREFGWDTSLHPWRRGAQGSTAMNFCIEIYPTKLWLESKVLCAKLTNIYSWKLNMECKHEPLEREICFGIHVKFRFQI